MSFCVYFNTVGHKRWMDSYLLTFTFLSLEQVARRWSSGEKAQHSTSSSWAWISVSFSPDVLLNTWTHDNDSSYTAVFTCSQSIMSLIKTKTFELQKYTFRGLLSSLLLWIIVMWMIMNDISFLQIIIGCTMFMRGKPIMLSQRWSFFNILWQFCQQFT